MCDCYPFCSPGLGVPESSPAPTGGQAYMVNDVHKPYQRAVEDPDAGLTPAEAERWRFLQEAKRSGKLWYSDR
ncbi:hypothetical protein FA95DRAFT_120983 [Auriscalpium vulgare]|uniref:Uncharacterized protein n=1 Tax=Auriscalpium vulgare TaxID=40419 RepID=A0ACB8RN41_9AGAM|nr:hypothetical protein FA95DRAFT_120983 [Auriscalpium vulgare]